mgnify:CR=1 FL=1
MASFDINNNILSKRWEKRYEILSDEVKQKLDDLDVSNCQLHKKKKNLS